MIENDVLARILYKHGYTESITYMIDGKEVPYWISCRDNNCEITIQRNPGAETCNMNYTMYEDFNFSITLRHLEIPLSGIDTSIAGLEQDCADRYNEMTRPHSYASNEYDPSDKWV